VSVDLRFPNQLARRCIDGVNVCGAIADECREAWAGTGFDAADAHCSAHRRGCLKIPVDTAGGGA